MSKLTIVPAGPGLTELAKRINDEHDKAESSLKAGLQHALECGKALMEAKTKCPHGGWASWLELQCTVSHRTANIYMRLARQWPKLGANSQRVANFSLREAIATISQRTTIIAKLPEPIVAKALDEPTDAATFGAIKQADNYAKFLAAQKVREAMKAKSRTDIPPPAPMPAPSLEQIVRTEALNGLAHDVEQAIATSIIKIKVGYGHGLISADHVCEVLNSIYCRIQDGLLDDVLIAAVPSNSFEQAVP